MNTREGQLTELREAVRIYLFRKKQYPTNSWADERVVTSAMHIVYAIARKCSQDVIDEVWAESCLNFTKPQSRS